MGLPHRVLLALYALAPLWLLVALHSDEQLAWFLAPMIGLSLPMPAIAFVLWKRRSWSWWALQAHSGVFVTTTIGCAVMPDLTIAFAVPGAVALATALDFVRADMRNPYRARGKRGFRQHTRFAVNLATTLRVNDRPLTGETVDISEGGAYVVLGPDGLKAGDLLIIDITLRQDHPSLHCAGRIASVNPSGVGNKPAGIGVVFSSLTPKDREILKAFIDAGRRAMRMPLRLDVHMSAGERQLSAQTSDVSIGGFFAASGSETFAAGDRVFVKLTLHDNDVIECVGEVAWQSQHQLGEKPAGLAVQFSSLGKRDTTRLAARLAEGEQRPLGSR